MGIFYSLFKILLSGIVISFFLFQYSFAGQESNLWIKWQEHDPDNIKKIDNSLWNNFLIKYVDSSHPSGINRVRYKDVTPGNKNILSKYLHYLQSIKITQYNRNEQKAFWINLYNALTIELILDYYPIESIMKINISPGLLKFGPWDAKLVLIEEEKITLNDIKNRILRPIWKDNRIHYALNSASIGSPNLIPVAYTSQNLETLLEKGAKQYVNHPRGVIIKSRRLYVSKIYQWYKDDFGEDENGLISHFIQYAETDLAKDLKDLKDFKGNIGAHYDWHLNE